MKIFGYELKKIRHETPEPRHEIAKALEVAEERGYRRKDAERDLYYQNWRAELVRDRQALLTDQASWQNTKDSYVIQKLKELGRC